MANHPFSYTFEKLTVNWKNRILFSFILAFITTLFSGVEKICYNNRCINYFFEAFNLEIISNPIRYHLFNSFLITITFFFLIWMVILSLAVSIHSRRFLHELAIPVLVLLLFIFISFVTTGGLPKIFLETRAIECVTSEDCIRAGYCGEVCTSIYQPVYTTYSPNCKPLKSCTCIDNKCVGS